MIALFLLVIVGEFNAGKSAFINALVGAEVMPEGVTRLSHASCDCAGIVKLCELMTRSGSFWPNRAAKFQP